MYYFFIGTLCLCWIWLPGIAQAVEDMPSAGAAEPSASSTRIEWGPTSSKRCCQPKKTTTDPVFLVRSQTADESVFSVLHKPAPDVPGKIATPKEFWNPSYFGNSANGSILRFNRVLIGVAARSGGGRPALPPTWADAYTAVTADSQLASISALGTLAITGISRTSDYRSWAADAAGGSQGITGIGVNDDHTVGTVPIACGVCGIVFQNSPDVGISLNQMDVNNNGAVVDVTPSSQVINGSSYALGLTSGSYKPWNKRDVSAALYIGSGGVARFRKGIESFANSYSADIGSGGAGVAFEAAGGQSFRWLSASNVAEAELWGDGNGLNVTGSGASAIKIGGIHRGAVLDLSSSSSRSSAAVKIGLNMTACLNDTAQCLYSDGTYVKVTSPVNAPSYNLTPTTVKALPKCNRSTEASLAYVIDASSPLTYGAPPIGGGTLGSTVLCARRGAPPTYVWSLH